MKWLAAMLLIANIALWFYGGQGTAVSTESQAEGRLPRVSALEVVPAANRNEQSGHDLKSDVVEQLVIANDRELSVDGRKEAPVSERQGVAVSNQAEQAEVCIEIGWFEDEAAARAAARTLGVTEVIKRILAVERPRAPFHWVIVPPVPSRSDANQLYREIRSMGIDAYLVAQGEQKNAISLGLFESRVAAERVLARRKAQELDAKLVTFPRNRISYALVFSAVLHSDTEAGKSLLGGYEGQFDSVKISECEGVATADKNP
ncbi:SPOR domain-containing protein [Marinobacter changyiensis]|uniref:SPOR domain-containing protein n=1 Tax=Marinobacter changyiensis TaxID=2604091 RepID=UPI0012652348|nr:SPOR domain-containing protein [Marinobacter changyiensis]